MKLVYPICFTAVLFFFLFQPSLVLSSAQQGISLWFNTVLPTLLPFFILNRLLLSYGVVDYFAAACHKLTGKLLKVPGDGGFALAVGYTSGAPVSGGVIADLYRTNRLTKRQAERLLPASSNVSPLFLFSIVAISLLGMENIGVPLAIIHYGTNLLISIIWALFDKSTPGPNPYIKKTILPPFGKALSEAVSSSLKAVALVGGIITVFFVWIALLDFCGVSRLITTLGIITGGDGNTVAGMFHGFWEVTAGSKSLAATDADLRLKVAAISGILAFGGLSVRFQIASQLQNTDLSLKTYTIHKIIQGVAAFLVAYYWNFTVPTATGQTGLNEGHGYIALLVFYYGAALIGGVLIVIAGKIISVRRQKTR